MTHQLTGVAAAAVTAAATDARATTAATLVAAAWLGALLPDVDKAGSHVHQRTRLERRHAPIKLLGTLLRLPLRALALLPHRGITHSVAAIALFGVLAAQLAPAAGLGLALGYAAHVAGDACTPAGVPLWAPLSNRRQWLLPKPARIPTGSIRERVLAATITVALVVFLAT